MVLGFSCTLAFLKYYYAMNLKQYLNLLLFFIFSASIFSQNKFTTVTIDTLFKDKISIRALLIDHTKIWYAGDKNRFGSYDLNNKNKFERTISNDTIKMEFRSIAQTDKYIFVLKIGYPALLYRFSKVGVEKKIVYQENNPKVFYDSMRFFDDNFGIAIGDPTEDCLSIIITKDGGETWQKIPCSQLPKLADGEAAFAASNTNVVVKEKNIWIVTGGKKANVYFSPNRGISWKVYKTPIVQGENMTGIFTADFYDLKNGFIAGGNYDKQNQNFENKAISKDGGKTWKLVADNQAFGYASCVQYVPNSSGKQLVSIGTSGVFYSSNNGQNWVKLSDNKDLYTFRFLDKKTAIAAGKNIMLKLNFKEINN